METPQRTPVLIADDDPMIRLMLADVVADGGYDPVCVEDGRAALEAIREGPCRLVITDWEMPRMSGVELCRAIRADDTPGYCYVILLTSKDAVADRVAGLRAGADDFVGKPVEPDELLARLGTGRRVLSMETRDVAIFAMAKLAESRDPETGVHLERVRCYCRLLAQDLATTGGMGEEITPEYCRLMYATSPLHDIGKVGVPDAVLLKPGRLTAAEFEVMKTHTTLGAQTLDAALRQFPNVPFLRMGRDVAASHHERYDGTGYPAGLAGAAIPLCGRITAVADVYDALTSKRVYKEAITHDVAVGMIRDESGTHFDPAVVAAFLRLAPEFAAVRRRMTEAA